MKLNSIILSLAAACLLPVTTQAQNVIWDYTALGAAPATNDKLFLYDTSATASKTMTIANLFTSPSLTTPTLGVATATSLNGLTVTSSTGTLTITNGKTAAISNTLTFTGTDSSSVAFGAGGTVAYTGDNLSVFAATTSAQLAGVISNETGSGVLVLATSPTLVTPVLGVATATSINKLTLTAPATGATLTLTDGKTLAVTNSITFSGTDSTTMTFPTTSATIARTDAANTFTGTQTVGALVATTVNGNTISTGSGTLTLAASKTLSANNTLTLAGTDGTTITFQGTDTYLGRTTTDTLTNKSIDLSSNTLTATSAQLATALSNETGSGVAVFSTAPTITGAKVTPNVETITGDGAITIQSGTVLLTKGSAAAITLAAPSSQDGTTITITSTTDFAHVVTVTGGMWDGTATTNTTVTFPVVAGGAVTLIAFGTDWYVLNNQGTTIAP